MRPDEPKFQKFVRCLEEIDEQIAAFAGEHGLTVVKNSFRSPSRLLRGIILPRVEHPLAGKACDSENISIQLADYWVTLEYEEDLPYLVGVNSYYYLPQKSLFREAVIEESQPFSLVKQNLLSYLIQGLSILQSWSPPHVSEEDPDAESQGWNDYYKYYRSGRDIKVST